MTTEQITAIQDAITALGDWVNHCQRFSADTDAYRQSFQRIFDRGGTIAYATEVRQKLEKLLADNPCEKFEAK